MVAFSEAAARLQIMRVILQSMPLALAICGIALGEIPQGIVSRAASEDFKVRREAKLDLSAWGRHHPQPEIARDELFLLSENAEDPEVRLSALAALRDLLVLDYKRENEKGYVGVLMAPIMGIKVPGDPEIRAGVQVTQVVPNSPADLEGIEPGDIVVGVDDQIWRNENPQLGFSEYVQAAKPGTKVELSLLRNGALVQFPLTLGLRPLDLPMMMVPGDPLELAMELERKKIEEFFKRWIAERRRGLNAP